MSMKNKGWYIFTYVFLGAWVLYVIYVTALRILIPDPCCAYAGPPITLTSTPTSTATSTPTLTPTPQPAVEHTPVYVKPTFVATYDFGVVGCGQQARIIYEEFPVLSEGEDTRDEREVKHEDALALSIKLKRVSYNLGSDRGYPDEVRIVDIEFYAFFENRSDGDLLVRIPKLADGGYGADFFIDMNNDMGTELDDNLGDRWPEFKDFVRIPAGDSHCKLYADRIIMFEGDAEFSLVYWNYKYYWHDGENKLDLNAWVGIVRSDLAEFSLP